MKSLAKLQRSIEAKRSSAWRYGKMMERELCREVSEVEVLRALGMGPVHFAGANTEYIANNTVMGRTPAIWNVPSPFIDRILEKGDIGDYQWENFLQFSGAVSTNVGTYYTDRGQWTSFESTGGSIAPSATDIPNQYLGATTYGLGVLKFRTGVTAHNSVAIEPGQPAGTPATKGVYSVGSTVAATVPNANSGPLLMFETRIRCPVAQSTGQYSFFLGVAVPNKTSAANTVFNATDVYQTMAAIGFQLDSKNSTTAINGIYGTATATTQAVTNGTIPGATTWTKLGFIVNPNDPSGRTIQYYQDGVLLGVQYASGTVGTLLTAANWPSNVLMTPLIYVQMTGAGTTTTGIDVDWIAAGQQVALE